MSLPIAPLALPVARPPEFEFLPDEAFIPVAQAIPTVLPSDDVPIVDQSDPLQLFVRLGRGFARFAEWCFGFVALMVGLAVLFYVVVQAAGGFPAALADIPPERLRPFGAPDEPTDTRHTALRRDNRPGSVWRAPPPARPISSG